MRAAGVLAKGRMRPAGRMFDMPGLVGIATGYGLDCQGIEWQLGRDFSHPCRPALGSTQHLVQMVPVIPGGKQPGRAFNRRRGLSKGRATLLIPYCAFMAGCRVNFTLFTFYI